MPLRPCALEAPDRIPRQKLHRGDDCHLKKCGERSVCIDPDRQATAFQIRLAPQNRFNPRFTAKIVHVAWDQQQEKGKSHLTHQCLNDPTTLLGTNSPFHLYP